MTDLFTKIFNFKEALHHTVTPSEIELIKQTNLFSKMDSELFDAMCRSLKLVKYPKGSIILHEHQKGDVLYIIQEGSVRVFTVDANNLKVPLARLNRGDYFGEQALLGQGCRTRSANVEAMDTTLLIAIDGKILSKYLTGNSDLQLQLTSKGIQQAKHTLSMTSDFFSRFEKMISQMKNIQIVEYENGDPVFNLGDAPDDVYLILQGMIELKIPKQESYRFNSLILHQGHLFGELGVLDNKPRYATATANGPVRLMKINGDEFKSHLAKNQEVQLILSELRKVYQIPNQGAVEQFLGYSIEQEPIITTIYNLNDGRVVVSTKFINQAHFSMLTTSHTEGKSYQYQRDQYDIEIIIQDNHLSGLKLTGFCDELPNLCEMILDHAVIDNCAIEQFEKTGQIPLASRIEQGGNEVICNCLQISRQQLRDHINKGIDSLEELSNVTGACTSCGGCRNRILEMLGQTVWYSGKMKQAMIHNPNIRSYKIKLNDSEFSAFIPGQHLIVQSRIGNHWIERPYTISDIPDSDRNLRLTIKKEPKGYFTTWLFANEHDEIKAYISQPQGKFLLCSENRPILCFAGGIGITPFITFARFISTNKTNQRMHLVYTALTPQDFICQDVFNQISKEDQSFTIEYRATNVEGYLTEKDIVEKVRLLGNPDVYICGPEPFLQLIQHSLDNIQYDKNKIHAEIFVHAGAVNDSLP